MKTLKRMMAGLIKVVLALLGCPPTCNDPE